MKALTPPRLLAAAAAACFVLPSCHKNTEAKADPQWWNLESKRLQAAHQVELLELRLSKKRDGDQGFAALEAEVERGNARRHELVSERDGLRQEVEGIREAVEMARTDWMRTTRGAAIGREFAKLTGIRGRTYEGVVITRVTDVGVEFRHSTGTARLAAADLTPSQHEIFGLDAGLAGEAIRQEQETALAYHSWVDERVAAAAEVQQEEDERKALAMASTPAPRATPSFAAASLEPAPRSRLQEGPRSFGSSGSTVWYSSGYYYRPSYYRYRSTYLRPNRASIFYDPCTGGAPARVNAPSSYRVPSKTPFTVKPRASASPAPVTSTARPSLTTP